MPDGGRCSSAARAPTRPTSPTGSGSARSTTHPATARRGPRRDPPGHRHPDPSRHARRGHRLPSGLVKLMYAAWGYDLGSRLRDQQFHARLRDAGVRRLQLNLDDQDVAPAMRIATGDPIGGIVSVWAADERDVTKVFTEATGGLAGWEVDERQPIPPPEAPNGVRMDALANVAVLKRPDDLDRAEWLHRWLVDHTPVAIATQASFGYVQNIVTRQVTDTAPRHVDALV